jgi:hypothetical protein
MTDTITTLAAIGIDLGDKDAHYACLNEEGKFTEEGTVAMTPAGLRKHFAKLPRTRIAIEAGAQSRWIAREVDGLEKWTRSGEVDGLNRPSAIRPFSSRSGREVDGLEKWTA